jgi:hypothetical protein
MSLGQSWARPLEHTWFVRAEAQSEQEIEERLAVHLDMDDGLIVQPIQEDAILTNTALRWFRQRRAGIDVVPGSNVLAFPAAPSPAALQQELPLKQAS